MGQELPTDTCSSESDPWPHVRRVGVDGQYAGAHIGEADPVDGGAAARHARQQGVFCSDGESRLEHMIRTKVLQFKMGFPVSTVPFSEYYCSALHTVQKMVL